jgi:hypothetical protein
MRGTSLRTLFRPGSQSSAKPGLAAFDFELSGSTGALDDFKENFDPYTGVGGTFDIGFGFRWLIGRRFVIDASITSGLYLGSAISVTTLPRMASAVDTITITGYAESQTPASWNGGDDTLRPFRDFAKGAPYACYAEEEKLFITTVGGEKNVPYLYSTSDQDKFLFFNFGGREEALKRTGD